jgi:thiol-disulfide isomerase/thioredoxin
MRTIVPFVPSLLFFSISLYAQPPLPNPAEQIERLEKRVADGHSIVQDRVNLVNLYFQQKNIEGRRRHVLWLIENHPDTGQLVSPPASLDRFAPLPDPVGFAQADKLWREQVAKPGVRPKVIGNAVRFFRFEDRAGAISALEAGERVNPGDPDLAGWRGTLDAMTIGGVIMTAPGVYGSDHAIQRSPEALRARKEIESSSNAKLIGGAAQELTDRYFVFADAPALNGEDALDLAEKCLLRARELDPENAGWKTYLSRVYEREAGQTADPKWKVQLFRKADAIDRTWNGLPQLALAEFEAGDDEAAARDAHRLLDRDNNPPPNFAQVGHTVLGRVALAKGNVAEAKAELLASVPAVIPPGMNMEPNRTLAQDLMDHGEREAVVQFLEQCREFWKNDQGAIDHYIKVAKVPGTHDLLSFYRAGTEVRGREVKLLAGDHPGKIVAVQFRNKTCKTCDGQFAEMEKLADEREVFAATVDAADQRALAAQLEIETYPTVVFIGRDGRVSDYLAGNVPENLLRTAVERLSSQGPGATPLQKLPAPVPIASGNAGTLEWSPVAGAESYLVQWDQRDEKGWISDRDEHLVRVIPAHGTSVKLDPSLGETAAGVIRWRVFAVNRSGPGATSDWREMKLERP